MSKRSKKKGILSIAQVTPAAQAAITEAAGSETKPEETEQPKEDPEPKPVEEKPVDHSGGVPAFKAEDTRNSKQRREDRKALKNKALEKADEMQCAWDDTIPAMDFELNFDAAYTMATTNGKGRSYTQRQETKAQLQATLDKINAKAEADPTVTTAVETLKTAAETPTASILEAKKHFDEQLKAGVEEVKPLVEGKIIEASNDNTEKPVELVDEFDSNGKLIKREGESNNKYKDRLNRIHREKKAAEKAAGLKALSDINKTLPMEAPEDETRNGPAPVVTPTGEFVHNSDAQGQTLEIAAAHVDPPSKDAKESANVFEAAAMGETNEPATEAPNEVATEEVGTVEPTKPVDQEVNPAEKSTQEQEAVPERKTELKLVPNTGSKLKEISENSKKYEADAKKFYGKAFTPARAADLTDAFRLLCIAIRSEAANPTAKMADSGLKKALEAEVAAFAIVETQAKAA